MSAEELDIGADELVNAEAIGELMLCVSITPQ